MPLAREPTPEAPVPFGRYRLLRRLGAGGMGEVFLGCEAAQASRTVVVKKVLPSLAENRAFVGRFLDEARVVLRLDHPNIVRVFAMGELDGEYFLAMEYVQGKTVSHFARRLRERQQALPLGLALLVAERVCDGLAYAHRATDERELPLKLVHRDLSPANVCVSYAGEVKIIDFGAAQSSLKAEQTAPRVVIGNLSYMAPEQARKRPLDGRADLYSCGVLLWELLAGVHLSQQGDPLERWKRAASPAWQAPSSRRPGVPEDVDALVLKALAVSPAERYPDAEAFAAALRAARQRHAPRADEAALGALLGETFAAERRAEEAVLRAAARGLTHLPGEALPPEPLAPPTALAFEHGAAMVEAGAPAAPASGGHLAGSGASPAPAEPTPVLVLPSGSADSAATPWRWPLAWAGCFLAGTAVGLASVWWLRR